jgi:FKBP-type peptidyl-prolyl cis-trans isomerase
MRRIIIPLLTLVIGAAACNRASGPTGPTPIEQEKFAPQLGVDLDQMTRTNSGLYLQDLEIGTGAVAEADSTVSVHYTGRLVDGWTFDTSAGRQPITFVLGARQVIAGWDEGLKGMQVGGRRKLVIPSHLAYGKKGSGPIPAYATLVFDVVLVEVK